LTANNLNRCNVKGGENKSFLENRNRTVMQKEESGEKGHYLEKNNYSDDHTSY